MLCITKDLSRNGYDTARCTFQLIDLMRTMDKKKRKKKCIQKPIKQNYFSDLQVLDSLGPKEAGKLEKTQAALQCGASFLLTASVARQSRCAILRRLALLTSESSRQVSTDLGNFLQFPAPVLPVKPSILQCS